jgi:uncharacterized protein (DUF433 family)
MMTQAATTPTAVSREHIEVTPGACGGRPRIAGTRIRVQDVYVWHERQGKSPDEIVSLFPHLSLADVHAALAYFWDHREEILHQVREDEALVARMKAETASPLQEKRAKGNGHDPLPS